MQITIFSYLQSLEVYDLWKFVGDGKIKLFFSLSQTKDELDKTTAIATLSVQFFYVVHAVQVCESWEGVRGERFWDRSLTSTLRRVPSKKRSWRFDHNAWLSRWFVTHNTDKTWPGISMFYPGHMASHMPPKVKLKVHWSRGQYTNISSISHQLSWLWIKMLFSFSSTHIYMLLQKLFRK